VLGAMQRDEEILFRLDSQTRKNITCLYLRSIEVEHLFYRIARDENAVAGNPFSKQICAATLGIGHQDIAAMVDDAAVYLFRNAVIEAAVACFHVVDRNTHTLRDHGEKAAIGVSKDQEAIRLFSPNDLFALDHYPPDLFAHAGALDAEIMIRFADVQLPKENVTQALVEVLPGMYDDVITQLVESGNDATQANDLRARTYQRKDFH